MENVFDNKLYNKYSSLLKEIGYDRLLALPEPIKKLLIVTTDLPTKVELLEKIKSNLS